MRYFIRLLPVALILVAGCGELQDPGTQSASGPPPSPPSARLINNNEAAGERVLDINNLSYQRSAVDEASFEQASGERPSGDPHSPAGGTSDAPAEDKPQADGQPAEPARQPGPIVAGEEIELYGVMAEGEEFDWESYRGDAVIVTFWASWCGGCRGWLQQYRAVENAYSSEGLRFVGVTTDKSPQQAKRLIQQYNIDFENILDAESGFPMRRMYHYEYIPHLVLVDQQGKVIAAGVQPGELVAHLTELLGPPGRATRAGVGSGRKGRGYGGGMVTEPLAAHFRAKEKLVFDIQIPQALKLFKAEKGFGPRSHDEFMKEIIEKNNIELPELPEGHRYVFNPVKGELMVRRPE